MSWFKILMNAGKFIALAKSAESLIKDLKDKKDMKQAISRFLSVIQDLLASGAIDIPGVEEQDIVIAIQEVRNQL